MFGFLAALGPIGIAAAVVGTVATAAMASSSSSSSRRSSNRREVQENHNESKKDNIRNDIESYKCNSIKKIKNKYSADIEFTRKKDKVEIVNKNKVIKNEIKKLKNEVDEIVKLIAELGIEKHEAIG